MSQYKRRSTKRRKKQREASIVGDLFRILLAVSMLVVAILLAFLVMQNISGFSLPDLKVTQAAETEAAVTVRVPESTQAVETTQESVLRTEAESTISEETSGVRAETEESSAREETSESEKTETSAVLEASDPETAQIIEEPAKNPVGPSGGVIVESVEAADSIYESPVQATENAAAALGPGFEVEIGNSPVGRTG